MRFQYCITIILSFFLCACSSDEPGGKDNTRQPVEISRSQEGIIASQNDFALRLFSEAMDGRWNGVISPLSVSMSMCMAANGATGETYHEICSALGLDGADISEVNSLNKMLIERLPEADRKTTLSIANSLWVDNDFKILDLYRDNVSECYGATVRSLDFSSAKSMRDINRWVADKTRGQITDILSGSLGEESRMVLLNTISFKSLWEKPFPGHLVKDNTFRNASGKKRTVKMMTSGVFPATMNDDGTAVVSLDYGNKSFTFTAILPPEGVDLAEYSSSLDSQTIMEAWRILRGESTEDSEARSMVDVTLPLFKVESEYDLIPLLKRLGINAAFSQSAEFDNLTPGKISLTDVFQKTVIEVTDKGVEASVATKTELSVTTFSPMPDGEIIFNRPFIYIISETSTGTILFMGNVSEL